MDKEFYIIKRTPWEYDKLPQYYEGIGGRFTRTLSNVYIFDDLEQAIVYKQVLENALKESTYYNYSIMRM